jgi:hypothetical protein
MKGITLLQDTFMILAIMGTAAIMIAIIWAMMSIRGIDAYLGLYSPRRIEINVLSNPTKYDAMLLSFLEYEYQGMPMKKLLNAVAIQGKTDIWIDGKTIDVRSVSENFLKKLKRPYLLKMRNPEIIIAESNNEIYVMDIQKVSEDIFLLNGEVAQIELYIG